MHDAWILYKSSYVLFFKIVITTRLTLSMKHLLAVGLLIPHTQWAFSDQPL